MKTLNTLINLHQRELDEKRVELAGLEEQKAELLNYNTTMENDLALEYELAVANPEIGTTFESYRKMIRERQATIAEILAGLEIRMDAMSDIIAGIYSEVKKYEIILQKKIDEQNEQEKRKETLMLDEVAIGNYLKGGE